MRRNTDASDNDGGGEETLLRDGALHDVSQMLAVVSGRAQTALREGEAARVREHLEAILLAARDAGSMLRRLRGDGAVEPGVCRAADVVAEAARLIGPPDGAWRGTGAGGWVLETGIEADLHPALPAEVLREVLCNLLLNAVEALPDGGTVTVRAAADGGRALVSVADDGPGLPSERRDDPFGVGGSAKDGVGRGVGLAACRHLLRRHGADLVLLETGADGTAFGIVADRAAFAADGPAAVAGTATVPRGLKVLVVDDEPAVRDMLAAALSHAGCEVTLAADAESARRCLAADGIQVAIVDHTLPGGSGGDLVAELKRARSATVTVLMTGLGNEAALAGEAGRAADVTRSKPLDLDDLAGVLAEAARTWSARTGAADGTPNEGRKA